MVITKSRKLSFLIIAVIYVFALAVGIFVYNIFSNLHLLFSTLLADIAATFIVWFFGIIFKNSSVYDPYWSIAPIVILWFWLSVKVTSYSIIEFLILSAIIFWGIRLTFNWAMRWKGLGHQDWRYTKLKKDNPKFWFFTNLVGINLMPTLIVFIAMIPIYYSIGLKSGLSFITFLGYIICLSSILIQAISDRQMDLFRKKKPKNACIKTGLWRYCRHPNYLGEVSFWWGIWLMQIGINSKIWITVIGPVIMTLLFVFISIPLMEKHILEKHPAYNNYREKVPMILPWFKSDKV